jgi:hypothetical protein
LVNHPMVPGLCTSGALGSAASVRRRLPAREQGHHEIHIAHRDLGCGGSHLPRAVSCDYTGFCLAVGYFTTDPQAQMPQALGETWSGHVWSTTGNVAFPPDGKLNDQTWRRMSIRSP